MSVEKMTQNEALNILNSMHHKPLLDRNVLSAVNHVGDDAPDRFVSSIRKAFEEMNKTLECINELIDKACGERPPQGTPHPGQPTHARATLPYLHYTADRLRAKMSETRVRIAHLSAELD